MTAKSPLDVARGEIGVTSIGGRFQGPPFERYALTGEQPLPWCARFVRFCYESSGHKLPGNRFLIPSVSEMRDALIEAGKFHPANELFIPTANDLIILKGTAGNADGIQIGGHHVGLVESFDGKMVHSIDGDFGIPDQVIRVQRVFGADNIEGYGRVLLLGSVGIV